MKTEGRRRPEKTASENEGQKPSAESWVEFSHGKDTEVKSGKAVRWRSVASWAALSMGSMWRYFLAINDRISQFDHSMAETLMWREVTRGLMPERNTVAVLRMLPRILCSARLW